jgi:hypothetical protein
MSVDVERLLAAEDAAWRDLHDVFAAVPEERFDEPGVTPEGWSPKDTMFHVGAWLAQCTAVLERIRVGSGAEDDETTDARNAAWFAMSRELDVRTVRSELEAARVCARRCFGSLPDVTPEAWSWFEESGPIHYADHATDLRAWLARP